MPTWALAIPLCAALSSPRPSLSRISVPVLLGLALPVFGVSLLLMLGLDAALYQREKRAGAPIGSPFRLTSCLSFIVMPH